MAASSVRVMVPESAVLLAGEKPTWMVQVEPAVTSAHVPVATNVGKEDPYDVRWSGALPQLVSVRDWEVVVSAGTSPKLTCQLLRQTDGAGVARLRLARKAWYVFWPSFG
jgi:hypothetical protein